MNRETRRANLKKLQLPRTANSGNLRKTRSATTVSSSISNYFSVSPKAVTTSQNAIISEKTSRNGCSAPIQLVMEEPVTKQNETPIVNLAQPSEAKRTKRTKLTTFVFKDNQNVPTQLRATKQPPEDDFETPEKKVKKAPILRRAKATSKVKKSCASKCQPSVKSAFFQNEQLFSEITAQHCMAEQFNADEVQLALAISRSVAETRGILCSDTDEPVVDLVNDEMNKDGSKQAESVRNKLQKYGFRTAVHEDYNCLAAAFLPGANRRLKTKWANKFTALTLRNPDLQKKKVDAKINTLLQQQFHIKSLHRAEQHIQKYRFLSGTLRQCMEQQTEGRVLKDENALLTMPLEDYFVQELFEVTHLRAGHLLKDWRAIQGRDLSPGASSNHFKANNAKLQTVYKELGEHFMRKESKSKAKQKDEISFGENEEGKKDGNTISLIATCNDAAVDSNNIELEKSGIAFSSPPNAPEIVKSPSKEPPDKRLKVDNNDKIQSMTQNMRAVSPDIFADSDKEVDETAEDHLKADYKTKIENMNVTQNKYGITTYELYSSEEVKTYSCTERFEEVESKGKKEAKTDTADDVIDLTQNENENLQVPVEQSLSQDSEILAAYQTYATEERTFAVRNLSPRKVTDVEFNGLYEKYLTHSEVQKTQSGSLSITPTITARRRLLQNHSWQTLDKSVGQTTFKRSHSTSFTATTKQFKSPAKSIDLTQSDLSDENGDDDCIVLSDDEINYSIWKASKSINPKPSEDGQTQKDDNNGTREKQWKGHDFSVLDFLENESSFSSSRKSTSNASLDSIDIAPTADNLISQVNSSGIPFTSKALDRSRERAEFGILENLSETLTQMSSLLQTPIKVGNDNSLATSPSKNASHMKRFSAGSAQKFNTLLNDVDNFIISDDFDEFDRLIYGSPKHKLTSNLPKTPVGLERLLTAEINFQNETVVKPIRDVISNEAVNQMVCTPIKIQADVHTEYNFAGRSYKVRVTNTPKPDFTQQTEAELLKQLYHYGIKPLKRKQAVKMLEYIYSQTHPIMLEKESEETEEDLKDREGKQKLAIHANVTTTQSQSQPTHISDTQAIICSSATRQIDKIQLQDCTGDVLLRYAHELNAELSDEEYMFQTNISKKLSQALLPLHIAWYNLVCGNPLLHETILLFEPIDLQQIYLFFKQLGYRYEPKDLKRFFDQRCIIFRYDLTPPGKQAERHVRKTFRKKKILTKTKSLQN